MSHTHSCFHILSNRKFFLSAMLVSGWTALNGQQVVWELRKWKLTEPSWFSSGLFLESIRPSLTAKSACVTDLHESLTLSCLVFGSHATQCMSNSPLTRFGVKNVWPMCETWNSSSPAPSSFLLTSPYLHHSFQVPLCFVEQTTTYVVTKSPEGSWYQSNLITTLWFQKSGSWGNIRLAFNNLKFRNVVVNHRYTLRNFFLLNTTFLLLSWWAAVAKWRQNLCCRANYINNQLMQLPICPNTTT